MDTQADQELYRPHMSEYPFSLDAAHLLYHINLNVLDVVILFSLLKDNGLLRVASS